MKLTKEQLDEIHKSIQKKGFKYIDIQLEVLDHVASAIEEKMELNPNLEFTLALNQTYSELGIADFNTIEASILKGFYKKCNTIFWKNFFTFFHIKYIPFVLLLCFVLYKIQEMVGNSNIVYALFLFGILLVFITFVISRFKNFKYRNSLSYEIYTSYFSYFGYLMPFLYFALNTTTTNATLLGTTPSYLFLSIIMTLWAIYIISAYKSTRFFYNENIELLKKYRIMNN